MLCAGLVKDLRILAEVLSFQTSLSKLIPKNIMAAVAPRATIRKAAY